LVRKRTYEERSVQAERERRDSEWGMEDLDLEEEE
jgi:hypothetical protein